MKKLLQYLKPYKGAAVGTIFLTLVNNAMTLILPAMMSLIINNGITKGDIAYIKKMGVIMLSLAALGVIASIASSYCSSKTATGLGAELRRAVFFKVEQLSECDIEKIGTPSLITRTTSDINRIQEMVLTSLRILITAPIMLIGGTVMAIAINRNMAMIILLIIPLIAVIAVIVNKKIMPLFKVEQKKTDLLNKILREKLSGIRVIRAFNRSKYEDKRFRTANLELTSIALHINRLFALLIPIAIMIAFSLIIGIIWMGGTQIDAMSAVTQRTEIANMVGDLQAFVIYMIMIVFAVSMAAAMFIMLPRASVSAKRVLEVLDLEPMIKDPENNGEFKSNGGTLEFRNVSFGYPGASEPVLNDISFTCGSGEVTAIIGGTGCGKSTLINLIPRFYDVSTGQILLDGTDIRKVTVKQLHEKIGFVPQKAMLFSGSVADNMRFGKPDATEDEIWQALETACAADFVNEMDEKLDVNISQSGTNLSGGQKQRLAIARALIKNAEIYIFDDSFSALDFKTDAVLRKNIRERMKKANVIIVAQRVGTILDADRIIVLDEGKICGIGKHSELLETCHVYREIVESQLTKEDLAK